MTLSDGVRWVQGSAKSFIWVRGTAVEGWGGRKSQMCVYTDAMTDVEREAQTQAVRDSRETQLHSRVGKAEEER